MRKLSIITTTYMNHVHITQFVTRISSSCERLRITNYEIIIVDDGSDWHTVESICKALREFKQVKILKLSRNFGHHKALLRGISESKGEKIFIIDSDLEESPEWLEPMLNLFSSKNLDSVYGVQERRRGSLYEKIGGALFYSLAKSLFGVPIQKNMMTARLMSRKFADAVLSLDEDAPNLSGIFSFVGFNQEAISFRKPRLHTSNYNFRKKVSIVFNLMTSYSTRPLKLLFSIGISILIASLVLATLAALKWIRGDDVQGWNSIAILILFFGGLQLSFIGVIGLYIARIFNQVKNRPKTLVERIISNV